MLACPAGPSGAGPCPARHRGCHEARRLLAHYRRCQDLRRRGSPHGRACLVCSLVARHAKGSGGAADRCDDAQGGPRRGKKHNLDALLSSASCIDGTRRAEAGSAISLRKTSSMTLMPPQMPRAGGLLSTSSVIQVNVANGSFHAAPNLSTHCSSSKSPSINAKMSGKSVNGSVKVPFPILRHASGKVKPVMDPTTAVGPRRRANSCGGRQARRVMFAPMIAASERHRLGDEERGAERPATELRQEGRASGAARPRSASEGCGAASDRGSEASVEEQ